MQASKKRDSVENHTFFTKSKDFGKSSKKRSNNFNTQRPMFQNDVFVLCKKRAAFTLSCKTFRSNLLHAILRSRIARFSQTKCRNCVAHSYGFTLAETLIVLVILGIVASITVPAIVRRQAEAQNRAKIKKCMTVYDTGINKFIVENQLKSNEAVYQAAPIGNCNLTSQYFKVSAYQKNPDGTDNLCIFKVSDGVWWNISDILNPIIALNEVL